MKEENVNAALDRAITFDATGLDKCQLSLAVLTFMDTLESSANWWQKFGITAVVSVVNKWRAKNCRD